MDWGQPGAAGVDCGVWWPGEQREGEGENEGWRERGRQREGWREGDINMEVPECPIFRPSKRGKRDPVILPASTLLDLTKLIDCVSLN